jgi:hypothetical protein
MMTTTRWLGAAVAAAMVLTLSAGAARADEKEAQAVVDKAVKALGGEEKLKKVTAFTVKAKGSLTFGDNASDFTGQTTYKGLDQMRSEFESEFNGSPFKAATVIDGTKGWRRFGDQTMPIEDDMLGNEKRRLYLSLVTVLPQLLKDKGFKVETAGEEKVGDKPAVVLKCTGPDGKDFTMCFDKESGLPVKQTAQVVGFMGEDLTQETLFSDYKEYDGIKKATKSEVKRDGQTFLKQELTEFKVLDKVDADTFAEPK